MSGSNTAHCSSVKSILTVSLPARRRSDRSAPVAHDAVLWHTSEATSAAFFLAGGLMETLSRHGHAERVQRWARWPWLSRQPRLATFGIALVTVGSMCLLLATRSLPPVAPSYALPRVGR